MRLATLHAALAGVLLATAAQASPVIAVGSEGIVHGDTVEWQTNIVAEDLIDSVDLAVPLAEGTEIVSGAPARVTPQLDAEGRIVGLVFDHPVEHEEIRLRQADLPNDTVLGVPIVDTDAVQRVELSGAAFEPDPTLGLEARVGHVRADDLDLKQVRNAEKALFGHKRVEPGAIYFRANAPVRDAGGLAGTLVPAGRHGAALAVGVGAVLAAVVGVLIFAIRVLERGARAEAVDAYIEREFVHMTRKGQE